VVSVERPFICIVTFQVIAQRASNIACKLTIALSVNAGSFPAMGAVPCGSRQLESVGNGEVVEG
jgi:hypothetical protein